MFKWIIKSFQDHNGKPSAQRLTIFAFTVMFGVSWFMDLFHGKRLDSITLIIIGIVVLVGAAILKASDIVAILTRREQ
tara:strand:- start:186 stop:419 length:234 start_codon:yes stop_codon:yes gene_type:complete